MRSLKTVVLFGVLGGVFYLLDHATRPGGEQDAQTLGTKSELAEIISARTGLTVSGLVITPRQDGAREFRGLLREDGRLRPVFGRLAHSCPDIVARSDCWSVAQLEVNGQPTPVQIAALPASSDRITDDVADEEIETADISIPGKPVIRTDSEISRVELSTRETNLPTNDEIAPLVLQHDPPHGTLADAILTAKGQPIPVPRPGLAILDTKVPPKPTAEDGSGLPKPATTKPTHTVDRPVINARVGPGGDSPVIAQLVAGLPLAKIGQNGEWGQFIILDGDDVGREVWAALRIVKPLP